MDAIVEITEKLKLEIRSNSPEAAYLEAVVERKDLEGLNSILTKHFGAPAKGAGKNAKFAKGIQKLVDSLGGLRAEQSFYFIEKDGFILYAALWPWQSDPERTTVKIGQIAKT